MTKEIGLAQLSLVIEFLNLYNMTDIKLPNVKAPKSNAERQAEYRARRSAEERKEVRGIFATGDEERQIKEFAQELQKPA